MAVDLLELKRFYSTKLGRLARHYMAIQLREKLRGTASKRVIALGYGTPFMHLISRNAESVSQFMPQTQGVERWPHDAPNQSALVDPLELPLPDSFADVIMCTHLFEAAYDREELMRELWRIGAPDAQLIIITPNRRGLWANRDNTPFGHGNPFSRSQLTRLLKEFSYRPVQWDYALYLPPTKLNLALKFAGLCEKLGHITNVGFAGVHIVLAQKQQFPAITRREKRRIMQFEPGLVPRPVLFEPGRTQSKPQS